MTVIAYDGDTLVADGRMTRGTSLVTDNKTKLHKISVLGLGDCIIGFCGTMDVEGPWLKSLEENGLAGLDEFIGKDEEGPYTMRALLYSLKTELCYDISSEGGYSVVKEPIAIGSGCWIAQHFLTSNCSALHAVKEACKTELTCGGIITVYDIKAKAFNTAIGGE